jgi:N6-L-threonylcarbamoyladenine synthase
MNILAIESSCDETSASVITNGVVVSNIISSQHFHSKYGGVVPELASRAHIEIISKVVDEAVKKAEMTIKDIELLAVTTEPGLGGSLIVGSNFTKGLAIRYNLPIVPVNHIEGHLFSGCINNPELQFPFITLVVSGGHTILFLVKSYNEYEILGATRDDAAGEAFDKIASLFGLGYPGGPHIDRLAKLGDPKKYEFPRSMIGDKNFDFSFSGLKTSVRYFVAKEFNGKIPEEELPNLCASVQWAIVDVLVKKAFLAARANKVNAIVIAGGVSANSELRAKMSKTAEKIKNFTVITPEFSLCMDNAAMIGFIAEKKLLTSDISTFRDLTFTVSSNAIRAPKLKRKKH